MFTELLIPPNRITTDGLTLARLVHTHNADRTRVITCVSGVRTRGGMQYRITAVEFDQYPGPSHPGDWSLLDECVWMDGTPPSGVDPAMPRMTASPDPAATTIDEGPHVRPE